MHYRFRQLSASACCRPSHWPVPIYLWCTNDQHIGHIMSINYYYYLQANFMMFIMGTILMIAIVLDEGWTHVRQSSNTSCRALRVVGHGLINSLRQFDATVMPPPLTACVGVGVWVWKTRRIGYSDPPMHCTRISTWNAHESKHISVYLHYDVSVEAHQYKICRRVECVEFERKPILFLCVQHIVHSIKCKQRLTSTSATSRRMMP